MDSDRPSHPAVVAEDEPPTVVPLHPEFAPADEEPPKVPVRIRKLRVLALLAGLGLLAVVSTVFGMMMAVASDLPALEEPASQNSVIVDRRGERLGLLTGNTNRILLKEGQIAPVMKHAIISIEDKRFYTNDGVDLRGIGRALYQDVVAQQAVQGGSTIAQQFVKNSLAAQDRRTLFVKLREAALAYHITRRWTKGKILRNYLNTIYFGNGAYGIEAAAHQYFGKATADLTLVEGALIAGLIQRPGTTDPFNNPEMALERRGMVLERMHANGMITDEELLGTTSSPLALASEVVPAAERYPAAYFVEEVKQWILDDPSFGDTAQERRDLLFGGGLRVHTTVDLATQAKAEAAVNEFLPDPAGPAASLVAIDAGTGYVRAMVGGRDFFGTSNIAKLNLATQGPRQAGSAFKPLVLAASLAQGIDPNTRISAPACITIPLDEAPPWRPCNYGGGGGGTVTIAEGTVRSYNTLYAQLMMRVGPVEAMQAATSYGIRSPLEPVPSAVLGSNSVTAMDMASAYSTFANRGIRVPPVLVTRITRADGTVLFNHEHTQKKVLDAGLTDTLTSILEQVIVRGTGTRAKLDRPAAGKTGTADDWVDAWFAGYTADLATAVWVGFPEVGPDGRLIRMQPPNTPLRVTGGSYPAQIWQRFMSTALAGRPVVPFQPPTTTTTTRPYVAPPPTSALGAPTTVPDVMGKLVAEATDTLRRAGFRPATAPATGSKAAAGTVVVQSPAAGSTAPRGTTVTIEVVP